MQVLKNEKITLPTVFQIAFCGATNLTELERESIQEMIIVKDENSITTFAKGYSSDDYNYIDEALLNEAQRKAQAADIAILLVETDTERLPKNQHQLIRSVSLVQRNLIVLIYSENIVQMPWKESVYIILQLRKADRLEDAIDFIFGNQR